VIKEGGVTRRDIVNRRQAPKIAAETLPNGPLIDAWFVSVLS
jgi:hypothetical protein